LVSGAAFGAESDFDSEDEDEDDSAFVSFVSFDS
jgi:hypothetical protein